MKTLKTFLNSRMAKMMEILKILKLKQVMTNKMESIFELAAIAWEMLF